MTVDEKLVEAVQGRVGPLSPVVNAALASEVDRQARAAALRRVLAGWDVICGPVAEAATDEARRAFDDLDALDVDQAGDGRGAT